MHEPVCQSFEYKYLEQLRLFAGEDTRDYVVNCNSFALSVILRNFGSRITERELAERGDQVVLEIFFELLFQDDSLDLSLNDKYVKSFHTDSTEIISFLPDHLVTYHFPPTEDARRLDPFSSISHSGIVLAGKYQDLDAFFNADDFLVCERMASTRVAKKSKFTDEIAINSFSDVATLHRTEPLFVVWKSPDEV